MPEPVGILEISQRLSRSRSTVLRWQAAGLLPPHRWVVSGNPAWDWRDIERWAAKGLPQPGRPPAKARKHGRTVVPPGS